MPVTCAEAGEERNRASPAISDGAPMRPVGCPSLKASSPAVLSPNAVILLGKRLRVFCQSPAFLCYMRYGKIHTPVGSR